MRPSRLSTIGALALAASLALTGVAAAQGTDFADDYDFSENMQPMGSSPRPVPFESGVVNSDLAFWGDMAIQGTYEGFRLIDISNPRDPTEIINFTGCVEGTTIANQGDIVVWDNILVRSLNSPAPAGGYECGGVPVPEGEQGLVVFDIGTPTDPVGLTFVATPCGSHTASGVPDLDNGRLLIYNSASTNAPGCRGIDIIEVPVGDPASASFLKHVASGNPIPDFPFEVTVNPPSSAEGTYGASGATFGPHDIMEPITGDIVLVNDGTGNPTEGCEALVDFPEGAIALVDRGTCAFALKTQNAEAAGASAVIVANNAAGPPITMGGACDPECTISSVMVSLDDGNVIKAGLPAVGTVGSTTEDFPDDPERPCHDTGVILGRAMLAACAGHDGLSVWTLDPRLGGSLEDPEFLYSMTVDPDVTIGHSASFSWDGEIIIFGHEPGGGGSAFCQADTPDVFKSLFFFDSRTGEELGRWTLPRPQTETENCTIHNYNVLPSRKGNLLVSGNYQSGIAVVDFTDPANAVEVAFADPEPLDPDVLVGGGDWSSYWYNGFIYQSDMRRGLHVWALRGNLIAKNARKLTHLNPQTQEFTMLVRHALSGSGD